MRISLAALAVALCAAAMFYVGTTSRSDSDVEIREDGARAFDMSMPPSGVRRPPVAMAPVAEPMRDAMAAAAPGGGPAQQTGAASAARPAFAPGAAAAAFGGAKAPTAKDRAGYAGLLASPARFLLSKTLLGRPDDLAARLQRKDFGKGYVTMPIVRTVLESPTMVRAVLGNQALVAAFFATPAMRDPKTVRALADSALLQYVITSPGVMKAFSDPAIYRDVFMSPRTAMWAGSSPEAREALGRLTAAIAASPRG
jgi:hypothetical protein